MLDSDGSARLGCRSRSTSPPAEAVDEIGEAVQCEQPDEEEMPTAAGGQILEARFGRPEWKRSLSQLSILTGGHASKPVV